MNIPTIIKNNTDGFKITCKNPDCIGGRIETTLEGDSGYSNWTMMDRGKVAFKCHGCGKYGSVDEHDKPNELDNFEVICLNCPVYEHQDKNWDYNICDVDNTGQNTFIECKSCGQRVFESFKELPQ